MIYYCCVRAFNMGIAFYFLPCHKERTRSSSPLYETGVILDCVNFCFTYWTARFFLKTLMHYLSAWFRAYYTRKNKENTSRHFTCRTSIILLKLLQTLLILWKSNQFSDPKCFKRFNLKLWTPQYKYSILSIVRFWCPNPCGEESYYLLV